MGNYQWQASAQTWRTRNPMAVVTGDVIRYGQRVGKVKRTVQTAGGIEFYVVHPAQAKRVVSPITVPFFDDLEVAV